ncbi:MAG: HD-GYP domain-containing protein [Azonexus sp.]|nr:HD-GYP domain-containing protein [Azonexus sp.]
MNSKYLESVDFSRHERWLIRALGPEVVLLILNADGDVIWNESHPLAPTLAAQIAGKPEGLAADIQMLGLPEGRAAFYRQLGLTKDGPLGWGAVIFPVQTGEGQALYLDRLAELSDDMFDGIFEEHHHRADLEMMTEELSLRYEELHLVYAVDHHIQEHSGDYRKVFASLLQSTADHMNVDVVAFVRPGGDFCLHATSLSKPIHNIDLVLVEMRGDLFRFVQASGETMVMNKIDDPRRNYIFTNMPYKILSSPVRSGVTMDALIVLLNHADKPDFSNSDRKLAEVLANQLSGLSNTYLLLESMHDFNEQMAKALIEAVEAKDPYTRGHSERVNFLSMEIGKALELSQEDLDDLHWGSLLHDVGKIGIPDAVLCKPSALTRDEYTFIKVHPERSYDILRHIKHLEDAAVGARHHQEQYDGKGYPLGLKGDRIPLNARIMAVADTYDSITSSRAYRPGRSHEVAMKELERVAGAQLDPWLVGVFKEIVAAEPEWLVRFNIRRDKD